MAVGDARRGLFFVSPIGVDGLACEPELMDHESFVKALGEAENMDLFSFDDPCSLGLEAGLEQRIARVRPEARYLMDVWLGMDAKRREKLISLPLMPSYLRAPFTSKAKSGHPLIR